MVRVVFRVAIRFAFSAWPVLLLADRTTNFKRFAAIGATVLRRPAGADQAPKAKAKATISPGHKGPKQLDILLG